MAAAGRYFLRLSGVALAAAPLKFSMRQEEGLQDNRQISGPELVLVQIAFRHGARTPMFPAPCKELEPVTWKAEILMGDLSHTAIDFELKNVLGGDRPFSKYDERQRKKITKGGSMYGQLTKVGQQQMYNLGKKHGAWYTDRLKFLPGTFNPQEIYIRTTNIQRTIDSARCVIAGMYGKEQLKGNVVMYTRDEESEILYPNYGYCESFKRWFEYVLKAQAVNLIEGYQARQEELGKILGMNCSAKPVIAVHVRDIVATMIAHNMEVPQNILQNWNVIEQQAVQVFVALQCGLPHRRKEVLRVGIGKFLEEIVDNVEKKITGTKYKMMMYSVHDTSMTALLLAIGLFDDQWPDFTADLVFELYRDKVPDYYVRVLYKGEEKVLPGCVSPLCPVNKFKELLSEYFIEDWGKECQVVLDN